jgi:hypothetical protein
MTGRTTAPDLAPDPTEQRLRAALHAVAERTPVPAPPVLPPAAAAARPSRHRRTAVAAALAAALVPATGLGVAAATGALPAGLSLFGDERGQARTVERLGAVSGPAGEPWEVWAVTLEDGSVCVLDGPEGSTAAREPLTAGGSACAVGGRAPAGLALGAPLAYEQDRATGSLGVQVATGGAAQVELVLADGTVLATVVADGVAYGWVPQAAADGAVVVGRDAAGREVGRVPLDTALLTPPAALPVPVELGGSSSGSTSSSGGPSPSPTR